MKFGYVYPGQIVPALYNNLIRAPLFRHKPYPTDFLVVRFVFFLPVRVRLKYQAFLGALLKAKPSTICVILRTFSLLVRRILLRRYLDLIQGKSPIPLNIAFKLSPSNFLGRVQENA